MFAIETHSHLVAQIHGYAELRGYRSNQWRTVQTLGLSRASRRRAARSSWSEREAAAAANLPVACFLIDAQRQSVPLHQIRTRIGLIEYRRQHDRLDVLPAAITSCAQLAMFTPDIIKSGNRPRNDAPTTPTCFEAGVATPIGTVSETDDHNVRK
jgi:hypothetical protein